MVLLRLERCFHLPRHNTITSGRICQALFRPGLLRPCRPATARCANIIVQGLQPPLRGATFTGVQGTRENPLGPDEAGGFSLALRMPFQLFRERHPLLAPASQSSLDIRSARVPPNATKPLPFCCVRYLCIQYGTQKEASLPYNARHTKVVICVSIFLVALVCFALHFCLLPAAKELSRHKHATR